MSLHPTAIIDKAAQLGTDVTVGPYAVIEAGVEIGNGTCIGPHAVVYEGTTLGTECRVHAGAVIGDTPQDLAFAGGRSYVRVGDRCTLREGVTIHRGTKPESTTVVGDDCYLMGFSHLGHNVTLGRKVILANGVLLAGYVEVGDGAFISGNVVVHQFCSVGRLAMLGGASAISKDVPPFCTTRSGALNVLAGLNVIGLRRAGFTPDERKAVKQAFRVVYQSGLNVSQALDRLREAGVDGPAGEFHRFIEASERGVCGVRGGE